MEEFSNLRLKKGPEKELRKGLGKGLASLLPEHTTAIGTSNTVSGRVLGISMVSTDAIEVNTFQPRQEFSSEKLKELAASIEANGIIQPLIVRKVNGALHLIAGERRLRAAKMAGLQQIPVVIRQGTDREALELALIENVQREDLNCIEVGLSYFQLMEDFGLTQEEVAKRVGKNRSSVANHTRLLKLPEEIIESLRKGTLTFGHGKVLLSLTDTAQKIQLYRSIMEHRLSVRDTEQRALEILAGKPKKAAKGMSPEREELLHLSQRLGRTLDTKVAIQGKAQRGTIVIKYFNRKDLDRLSAILLQ